MIIIINMLLSCLVFFGVTDGQSFELNNAIFIESIMYIVELHQIEKQKVNGLLQNSAG